MTRTRPAWDFRASLVLSAVLHVTVLAWLWLHRPQVIEVSLPGSYTVDLVGGATEPVAPAPVTGPPIPVPRDEVVAAPKKVRPVARPAPAPQAQPQRPPVPNAPPGPATPATPEARIGLSGAPGVASDFPFSYYLVSVRNVIGRNWLEPGVSRRTRTTIAFRIRRDGTVEDARVETPSGVLLFDQAALRAVLASSPLPRLPADFKSDQLGVHFDFEVTR